MSVLKYKDPTTGQWIVVGTGGGGGGGGSYTDEQVRDVVTAMLQPGANITLTPNDPADTLTIDAVGGSGGGISTEDAVDAVAAALASGAGIDIAYNDATNTITITNTSLGGAAGHATFQFVSNTVEPPTGSQMRLNNVNQQVATRMWVSQTSTDGLDVGIGLARVLAGHQIYVQDYDDASKWVKYSVIADGVDDGAYFDFQIAYHSGPGGLPYQQVELQPVAPGAVGIPPGGTIGQVLGKTGTPDYAVGWVADQVGAGGGIDADAAVDAVAAAMGTGGNNIDITYDGVNIVVAVEPLTTADIAGLDTTLSNKQPLDADLTALAGLAATTNNVIQSVASAWASRTPAQLKTSMSFVKGDVGLANVDNTSDANKPISTATQTALDTKAATSALTSHESDTLDVHGIADTSLLETQAGATAKDAAHTGNAIGAHAATAISYAGGTGMSATNVETAIDELAIEKANAASPSFTGTVTLPVGLSGVLRADSGVVAVDADVTDVVAAATATAQGKVELATPAEATLAADNTRAVTPLGLADRVLNVQGVTGIWAGTQAAYDAIGTKSSTTLYVIT